MLSISEINKWVREIQKYSSGGVCGEESVATSTVIAFPSFAKMTKSGSSWKFLNLGRG